MSLCDCCGWMCLRSPTLFFFRSVLAFGTEKIADLESMVQSLQTQLQQEEEYAKDVVNQWQENCTAAEEECAAAKLELEEMKKSKEVLEASFNQTVDQSQVKDLESQLTERNEELRTALASIESNEHDAHELQGALYVSVCVVKLFPWN